MNIIQTSFDFQDEIPKQVFRKLRLHNGRYATKKQYIEDHQKVWEQNIIEKIRRLEAEKEVDRRKIDALIGWIKVLQDENKKLKLENDG
jgi:hypothetical protein